MRTWGSRAWLRITVPVTFDRAYHLWRGGQTAAAHAPFARALEAGDAAQAIRDAADLLGEMGAEGQAFIDEHLGSPPHRQPVATRLHLGHTAAIAANLPAPLARLGDGLLACADDRDRFLALHALSETAAALTLACAAALVPPPPPEQRAPREPKKLDPRERLSIRPSLDLLIDVAAQLTKAPGSDADLRAAVEKLKESKTHLSPLLHRRASLSQLAAKKEPDKVGSAIDAVAPALAAALDALRQFFARYPLRARIVGGDLVPLAGRGPHPAHAETYLLERQAGRPWRWPRI